MNIRDLTESSGYSLQGSFTPDLIKSKAWLISELAKIQPRISTMYVLGSWFGNLSLYIKLMPAIQVNKIINVEIDKDMLNQSQRMLDHVKATGVEHMLKDANDIDFRQLDENSVVVNTSLTDMQGRAWYDHIPAGTLVVLQARDNDPNKQFHSPEDIIKNFPLDMIYQGTLDLQDPETDYHRFMVIGTKPNTP